MEKYLKAHFTELSLTECGRESCNSLKNIVSDSKNWHLLHYILYGKGTYVLDGKIHKLTKGSIFYIPPNCSAQYYPDKDEPWIYVWVGFQGVYGDNILAHCNITRETPVFKDKKCELKQLFNELADTYNYSVELNLSCMSKVLMIFWEMMHLYNQTHNVIENTLSVKSSHVRETKQFIANNYQFAITVQDIADNIGLTPNYLANIFKEILQTSPKKYLTNYRIEKACHLLINENMMIKEIAERVGYKNQLHFSAEFKRVKKISPNEYQLKNKLIIKNQENNSEETK